MVMRLRVVCHVSAAAVAPVRVRVLPGPEVVVLHGHGDVAEAADVDLAVLTLLSGLAAAEAEVVAARAVETRMELLPKMSAAAASTELLLWGRRRGFLLRGPSDFFEG